MSLSQQRCAKPQNDDIFSKQMTQIAKGIAILAMFFHHMYKNNPCVPIPIAPENMLEIFAAAGKVCVCLFMILSGYGITKSRQNKPDNYSNAKFVYNHIINLLFSFMFVFLFTVFIYVSSGESLTEVYGGGAMGVFYFIKDMLGLERLGPETPSLCIAWWFMEAVFLCYLLFPLFYKIIGHNKYTAAVCLFVCYIPWIVYQICQGWDWKSDREIFYFFAFAVGVFCARYNIFDKAVAFSNRHKLPFALLSFAGVIVFFFVRVKLRLIADPFFALSVIFAVIGIFRFIPIVKDILVNLGDNSSNMYMSHMMIKPLLAGIPFIGNSFKTLCFLLICWGLAMLLDKLKELLHYNNLVKRLLIK